MWMNKISGAANIRGTVIITLQVNSSPYNAGGLLLHMLPNYAHTGLSGKGRSGLRSKSQQPGIKMDIATEKEVTMEIPYCAPTYYCNIAAGSYDWGRFFVTCWSPFTGGSAAPTKASLSIWMHMTNVELAAAIVAQSGVKRGQRGTVKAYKGVHPSEQERGPVSRVLSATSTIASTLATIPSLTTLAGPVAWFTNVAAGVASSFGWSKPLSEDWGTRMIKGSHFGAANANGVDLSQPLGLLADNKVRVMTDLGGSNEDQMSINFLKSVPSFGGTFNLSYTDVAGTALLTQPLGPKAFDSSYAVSGSIGALQMTTLGFLGRIFRIYRGGITVRFHFYKTQFHTGRIVIAFSPGVGNTPTTVNASNYLHRAIVDLSEGNEVCLNFPYALIADYTSGNMGAFTVFALNPLRGPDSVSSVVQCVMEVWGADDMEFQIPLNSNLAPIVAQSGGDNGDTDELLCENIGGSSVPQEVSGSSQYTVGEHVTSLLQLCKRYTRFAIPAASWTASGVVRIHPFVNQAYSYTAATTTMVTPACGGDYLDVFAGLYAYQRGGVRFRVMAAACSNPWSAWIEPASFTNTTAFYSGETDVHWRQAYVGKFIQPGAEGGISVQIPNYSALYTRICRFFSGFDYNNSDVPAINLALECVGPPAGIPSRVTVYRAAADDFQFSYFIGVPEFTQNYDPLNL